MMKLKIYIVNIVSSKQKLYIYKYSKLKTEIRRLEAILESKNYPEKLVADGIRRAKNIPQEELRKTKPPEENNNINIACVTTYNPTFQTSYLRSKTLYLY